MEMDKAIAFKELISKKSISLFYIGCSHRCKLYFQAILDRLNNAVIRHRNYAAFDSTLTKSTKKVLLSMLLVSQ